MEILNIGIPELVFILLIMLVVLGPARMESTARSMASTMRKLTHSDLWRQFRTARRQIEDLPSNLLRDSGVDEFQQQVHQMNRAVNDSLTIEPPRRTPTPYPARPVGEAAQSARSPLDPDIDPPPENSESDPPDLA